MLKPGVLAAALMLAATGVASAQDGVWEELGSGGGQTFSYNPLTVSRSGTTVSFTEKVAFAAPGADTGAAFGALAAYAIERVTLDCAASTLEHLEFTLVRGERR